MHEQLQCWSILERQLHSHHHADVCGLHGGQHISGHGGQPDQLQDLHVDLLGWRLSDRHVHCGERPQLCGLWQRYVPGCERTTECMQDMRGWPVPAIGWTDGLPWMHAELQCRAVPERQLHHHNHGVVCGMWHGQLPGCERIADSL